MHEKLFIHLIILAFFLSSCTWVDLSKEGEQVRVINSEQAQKCKLVGKTTVMVKATVATFARNEAKVQNELETLARNNAQAVKGNAVLPVSAIENGKQVFEVYQCP